jgi:hypothetical protein
VGKATATIPTSLTINVTDKNLGSWLSGQSNDNSVVGFSYDLFNGVPTLSMGFGSVPAVNNGGNPLYTNYSLKSLGRPLRKKALTSWTYNHGYIDTKLFKATPANGLYERSVSPYQSDFLKTFGIWAAGGINNIQQVTGKDQFFVRYDSTFTWQFVVDNSGSFKIDGNASKGYNQSYFGDPFNPNSGSFTLTAGLHTVEWNCFDREEEASMGLRITYASGNNAGWDVWSSLDVTYLSWSEISRITLINDGTLRTVTALPNVNTRGTAWDLTKTAGYYFKNGSGESGMFSVTNNGSGTLTIFPNSLAKQSANSSLNVSMSHITRDAMYYFSSVNRRYTNLEAALANQQTHVFLGFNSSGTVIKGTAPYPR